MLPSCHRNVNATSTSDETSASEIDDSSYSQNKTTPTRRKSKFVIKKELEKKVIEGRWKLVGNINFEEYLSEVGEFYLVCHSLVYYIVVKRSTQAFKISYYLTLSKTDKTKMLIFYLLFPFIYCVTF